MTEHSEKMDKMEVKDLLRRSVMEITRRVAGIEVCVVSAAGIGLMDTVSLVIHTKGDYAAALVMSASKSFFSEIAKKMKKSEKISDEDIAIYVTEYYNILCGFFISHFNSREHLKARFGIPKLISGCYIQESGSDDNRIELFFKSGNGILRMSGIGLP